MDDMTTTTKTWRDALRARGIDPETLDPLPSTSGQPETVEEAAERRHQQAENRAKRWRDRLPVMFQEAALTDLDLDAQEAIHRWLLADGRNLVLAGAVGTGKTHAAYALGHWLVAQGTWVEAEAVVDLLDDLKPGGRPWAEQEARECQVLILDDLGATRATEWAQERLLAIMDARLRNGLRTVITTNATSDQIAEAWGTRFMDRLRFRQTAVTFTGPSRREAAW
jgi:DNA replication protein DnaC